MVVVLVVMLVVVVAVDPFMSNEIDYYFILNLNQPCKMTLTIIKGFGPDAHPHLGKGSLWAPKASVEYA